MPFRKAFGNNPTLNATQVDAIRAQPKRSFREHAFGLTRFEPEAAGNGSTRLAQRHRVIAFIIGLLAIGLPIAMLIFGAYDCYLNSISHYYFSSYAGPVFVAIMVCVAAFLVAYTGQNPAEDMISNVIGVAALLVAIFPATGDPCQGAAFENSRVFVSEVVSVSSGDTQDAQVSVVAEVVGKHEGESDVIVELDESVFELFEGVMTIHFGAATIVFIGLAYYAIFVFTRYDFDKIPRQGDLYLIGKNKIFRNRIYLICGVVIILSVLILALNPLPDILCRSAACQDAFWWRDFWTGNNLTFVCEAAALISFGIAWFIKGRLWLAAWCGDDGEIPAQ